MEKADEVDLRARSATALSAVHVPPYLNIVTIKV